MRSCLGLRGAYLLAVSGLLLAGYSMAPDANLERVQLSVPRALLGLPPQIEHRVARVSASKEGLIVHLFDVRWRDPEGRFVAYAPRASMTPDGDITIDQPELRFASERAPYSRDEPDVREVLAALASLPLDRIRSLAAREVTVVAGPLRTEGARLDLSRDGKQLRGSLHLGSLLPLAEVFVAAGEGSVAVEAALQHDGTALTANARFDAEGLALDARADRAGLSSVLDHWPETFCSGARAWIAEHIAGGDVFDAELSAREETIALDFGFSRINARIPEVPVPLYRAHGRATLTAHDLTLFVDGVRAGDLPARATIRIFGFDRRLGLDADSRIDGLPLSIAWRSPHRVRLIGKLDRKQRAALGISEIDGLTGPIGVDLTIRAGARVRTTGKLDLTGATLSLPLIAWKKIPGVPASVEIAGSKAGGYRFELSARDLSASGSRNDELLRARIQQGENDFTLSARASDLTLSGKSFDARPLLAQVGSSARTGRVRLLLERVRLSDEVRAHRVAGVVDLRDGQLDRASGSAVVGGSELSWVAERKRGRVAISARAGDAGRLARGLGFHTSLSGGSTVIDGILTPDLTFEGRALLRDIEIDRSSAALTAVSATSIRGISDLIRGKGVRFRRGEVRFTMHNDRLTIARALFTGGPIGFSTRGTVDLDTGEMNLVARVAPLDDWNSIIRKIPVVGRLLAPEGDGLLLAPSYSVGGDLEHAQIRLQPQSLVPAFLRRIFE